VEAFGVEPGDVLDEGELELCSGARDAVADQLGLEAVDEVLGARVVVGVADGADRYILLPLLTAFAVFLRRDIGGD
jgi:hypothetical protein